MTGLVLEMLTHLKNESKEFWVQKIVGQKNLALKKLGSKKILSRWAKLIMEGVKISRGRGERIPRF